MLLPHSHPALRLQLNIIRPLLTVYLSFCLSILCVFSWFTYYLWLIWYKTHPLSSFYLFHFLILEFISPLSNLLFLFMVYRNMKNRELCQWQTYHFVSLVYIEIIFRCVIYWVSFCIWLEVWVLFFVQFSQHHLLKRLLPFNWHHCRKQTDQNVLIYFWILCSVLFCVSSHH